jgi:hypothetical protein
MVAGFTITISPDDDPDAGTSIHVDITAGGQVTELTVRPAKGGSLSPGHLAVVNLDALISALTVPAATAAALPGPGTGQPETAPHVLFTEASTLAAGQRSAERRAYRRMPDVETVLAAYRQVGGITALAHHFGVPRHTASNWLRRLRSMGHLDSPTDPRADP